MGQLAMLPEIAVDVRRLEELRPLTTDERLEVILALHVVDYREPNRFDRLQIEPDMEAVETAIEIDPPAGEAGAVRLPERPGRGLRRAVRQWRLGLGALPTCEVAGVACACWWWADWWGARDWVGVKTVARDAAAVLTALRAAGWTANVAWAQLGTAWERWARIEARDIAEALE